MRPGALRGIARLAAVTMIGAWTQSHAQGYPVKPIRFIVYQAAGGTSSGADLTQMRLYIPAAGEAAKPQKVDLNRAGAWLLEGLPEIGEVTAKRIVAYREQNGPFRSLNDLLRVEGIGQTTLTKIKDLITVSE